MYNNYKIAEFITAYFAFLSKNRLIILGIVCGVFYFEINIEYTRNPDLYVEAQIIAARYTSLVIMNISTLLFCIILVLRYIEKNKLRKMLKLIRARDNICKTGGIYLLVAEILMALVQPYPFLVGIKIVTNKHWYLRTVEYEINTLLLIPVLLRVYTVYTFLISISPYYSAKADRVGYIIIKI
jgi:hypothetical protein